MDDTIITNQLYDRIYHVVERQLCRLFSTNWGA